jgi:hypothetical protein
VKMLPQASVAVAVTNCGWAGQLMVEGAGNAAITGAVVSWMVMVCEAVAMFPQGSVAVQVLVMACEPAQSPGTFTSAKVNVTFPPQASVAVGVVNCGLPALQFIVEGAGNAEITGGVLSITWIICELVAELPQPSTATQVLVMV